MRTWRNIDVLPVLLLSFFGVASRVAFIFSSWVVLVYKFELNPIVAAVMSIFVQGFTTVVAPLSKWMIQKSSVLFCQRLGAIIGVGAALAIFLAPNISLFLTAVLIASISKVAIEGTLPRVTHSYIATRPAFSSKLAGVQQGAVLFAAVSIAGITFSGFDKATAIFTFVMYSMVFVVTILFKECGLDTTDSFNTKTATQIDFDRRFSDIVLNEDIRKHQSKIHKLRRIPSTLLFLDFINNSIGACVITLLPLCLLENGYSQGFESVLGTLTGALSVLVGCFIFPALQKRVAINDIGELKILTASVSIVACVQLFYTTLFGLSLAFFAGVVYGVLYVISQGLIHRIGGRNLTSGQYQLFGCQLMQRNAITRLLVPIPVGVLAQLTSIDFTALCVSIVVAILVVIATVRTSFIVHGRKFDERALKSIESSSHPARKLRTQRREGGDVIAPDTRLTLELFERQRLRQKLRTSSYNRRFIRFVPRRLTHAPSQKDPPVAATWRSSRSERISA